MKSLQAYWNVMLYYKVSRIERRRDVRRIMRQRLCVYRKGKGNKAWKRAHAVLSRSDVLVWPDYCV